MLESTLGFTIVVEAEFVDGAVVDGPSVGNVPLLKALFGGGSEAGDVGTRCLKLGKRRDERVVVEIVVEAQILLVIDTMVDLDRELIATVGLHRHGHERISDVRSRNKLKQVDC